MREEVPKSADGELRQRAANGTVDELIARRPERELRALYQFWSGQDSAKLPSETAAARARIVDWMHDPQHLESRVEALGRRLGCVFRELMAREQYRSTLDELSDLDALQHINEYDLRSSLETLERNALIVAEQSGREGP